MNEKRENGSNLDLELALTKVVYPLWWRKMEAFAENFPS